MTARQKKAAQLALIGGVLLSTIFFSRKSHFKSINLGERVPEITLKKEDGQTISLADFRGKVVILHFWATWCTGCVDELPSLKQFAEKYSDKRITVIGISWDEDPDAYKQFLLKYQINFLNVRNPTRNVAEMYGTRLIPETYIISADGHLLNKIIGPTDWLTPQMLSYFDSLISKVPAG